LLLTGPNKGGKTTYMQAIGVSQVLAQAGLYVPGTQAKISPVDVLHTHFPEEEQFDAGTGRFGDEAQRMHAIFTHITRHSLVLLNESFSSTSPAEALALSRDIVRLLREMGTRSVFATHLHELAAEADVLNASITGDSHILSLVASLIEEERAENGTAVTRSYKIIPSPPMQSSRARELARQYGVSFDQLHQLLRKRGVMREL
jgi:DNA mismatch repair ATPase MutS